jgi:hypothetical protein
MSNAAAEKPKIKKNVLTLTDSYYNHPNTSLLIFHFEPHLYDSSQARLQQCSIKLASIDEKHLYIFDNFFLPSEGTEMQEYSKAATFSRNSYGSPEAIEQGEKPAQSMNGKERWQFFSNPPAPLNEFYKLLSTLSSELNADITTLPWELCNPSSHGSPAVIANRIEEASPASMELGKHQDSNPEGGISYGIPVLYSPEKEFHDRHFINGATGKPWIVSVMVYTTAEDFDPGYKMGTAFYQKDGKMALRVDCLNMRLVLFESDIFHSIEESKIPPTTNTWRISYVYKLIVNPREKDQNIKNSFFERMSRFSTPLENLGPASRT